MDKISNSYNIAVLISGNGSNLAALIEGQAVHGYNIKVVISSNAESYGLTRARQANIDCGIFKLADFQSAIDRDSAVVLLLKKLKVDLVVCAGYLGILTQPFFDNSNNFDIVNIHPSLLPKHGGKGMHGIKVHQAVIKAGDKVSGATVHFVTPIIDDGQIIMQESIDIHHTWTESKLQYEVLQIEHKLIVQAVSKLMKGFVVKN